jgi:succinate dehydrogenase / fumarate reductase, cytochrome b subunit
VKLSSIRKKQIVAVSGLAMVGFLLAHLSGNLLLFKGPEAYNAYADFLHSLGPILWVLRLGLIGAVLLHIIFTVLIVKENRQARKDRYAVVQDHRNERSLAVKLMPYTGFVILAYIIIHLLDFTFADKTTIINGVDYGLYGLVITTLRNPLHAAAYIIAMFSIGFHLSHAFQSVVQTFGLSSEKSRPKLMLASLVFGLGVALAYSSIPLYVVATFR